ncbi:MAG: hypothetical protein ACK4YO_04015, partial [Candidatus Altarchaeaceae archaeon]
NNLTISDTIPDNFTYIDVREVNATELLQSLNITIPQLPLNLGVENLTAERITDNITVTTTDNKTYVFGSWRTRNITLPGLEIYTAIIALNVTLKAPSDIDGTPMNITEAINNALPPLNITIPLLNITIPVNLSSLVSIPADLPALPAQIFDNNVTIQNTKDNETENITNETGKIIVVEIEGINKAIKVCIPPLTMTDKNVSCLIA